jgi:hypothetical protein
MCLCVLSRPSWRGFDRYLKQDIDLFGSFETRFCCCGRSSVGWWRLQLLQILQSFWRKKINTHLE